MNEELEFARQFRPDGPVTVDAVLARQAGPDRDELEEAAAERAERDAAEERDAARAMLNYQMGDPIGHLSRATSAVSAARDRVRDLQGQLESAQEVLSRAESNMAERGREVDQVQMARRAATPDLLAEAKRAAAAVKVDAMLERAVRYPKEHTGDGCEVCAAARASERRVS
jgi:chromosome segregation ATPase